MGYGATEGFFLTVYGFAVWDGIMLVNGVPWDLMETGNGEACGLPQDLFITVIKLIVNKMIIVRIGRDLRLKALNTDSVFVCFQKQSVIFQTELRFD